VEPATPNPARAFSLASASLFVVGLAWTLPFLQPYHRYPITAFYTEWSAFALGLLAASLLLRKESWREPVVPVVALAPVGLILLLASQIGLGRVNYAEQALTAALYAAWAVLMMALGAILRRELGMAAIAGTLAWALVAGGLLSALAGVLQHYQVSTPIGFLISTKISDAVFGNLAQPNNFANYVTLAVASIAYLHARGSLHGAMAAVFAAAFLFVLTLTGSRSPWLYLGALAALALFWHRRLGGADRKRLCVFTLWLIPGFVAMQWLAALPFMLPKQGLLVTSADRLFDMATGIGVRLQLAGEAWTMFLGAPLLGIGWGQFAWHHFLLQAADPAAGVPGVFNHAHNVVMQLLAETGIVGALFVTAAVVLWLVDLRKVERNPEWWWLLALLAVISIHSMVEYPLWYSNFLGIAALLAGAGAHSFITLRAVRIARGAAAAALALGWLNVVMVVPAYRDFERLLFGSEKRAMAAYDGGAFVRQLMQVHRDPILQPYLEVAVSLGIAVNEEELRQKLDLNQRVMRLAPGHSAVYRQAMLLALAGEREAALTQLSRSIEVYPAELPRMLPMLEKLARRYPERFGPLLELAAAKGAVVHVREPAR
jgi:O-antigen ligase